MHGSQVHGGRLTLYNNFELESYFTEYLRNLTTRLVPTEKGLVNDDGKILKSEVFGLILARIAHS